MELTVPNLLVIGYGNTLRGDDGVGPRVAEAVAALNLPGVQTLTSHQLTPELAEPISKARGVVFVDAAVDAAPDIALRELTAAEPGMLMGHAVDPRLLLALARDVFGGQPKAWLLTVPASDLNFGDHLSETAERGVQIAVEKIRALASRR